MLFGYRGWELIFLGGGIDVDVFIVWSEINMNTMEVRYVPILFADLTSKSSRKRCLELKLNGVNFSYGSTLHRKVGCVTLGTSYSSCQVVGEIGWSFRRFVEGANINIAYSKGMILQQD